MHTIGRREVAHLPKLGLQNQIAKIDTGAYTSSLHCTSFELKDGHLNCVFDEGQKASFKDFHTRQVKSSNGIVEKRYSVFTKITLGKETHDIEITLTDRSGMRYPLLIGRKFLKKKFLVDVSVKNKLQSKLSG